MAKTRRMGTPQTLGLLALGVGVLAAGWWWTRGDGQAGGPGAGGPRGPIAVEVATAVTER